MRRRILLPGALALGSAVLVAGGVRADDVKPLASPAATSGCVLKGTFPVQKGTTIHDAASGGRAIATFTGAPQAISLSEIPPDPIAGRARISTSNGPASLRIDGWTSPSSIAVFTMRDVPVVPGHVWIADAQRVKLVAAASGSLTAELAIPGTSNQTARGAAPCDAWTLRPGTPTPMEVPGNGRGYLTKGTTIELFDAPRGSVVFTLRVLDGTAQLFWSNESRPGWVHVKTRGSLVIDAWARPRDLEPLKKGEMMDQFVPPTTSAAGVSLKLDGAPKLIQAPRDIPVRAKREDKDPPIGMLEAGAEVYVIETMLGWTNVLPKSLGVTPAGSLGFWIPAAEAQKPGR
jgi:hypothetical protein